MARRGRRRKLKNKRAIASRRRYRAAKRLYDRKTKRAKSRKLKNKRAIAARRRWRRRRRLFLRKKKTIRRTKKRKYKYNKRRPGLSQATLKRVAEQQKREEAEYEKFDAARTAIAKRLGVSPGHAQAHYRALIEHKGLSPKEAQEEMYSISI